MIYDFAPSKTDLFKESFYGEIIYGYTYSFCIGNYALYGFILA